MAPSPARQTFRETVALVAEKAKVKLPQAVNGRIESAVKLVLVQDVTPQADGSILVGSASDPLKTYRLVGTTCECQDLAVQEGSCDETPFGEMIFRFSILHWHFATEIAHKPSV